MELVLWPILQFGSYEYSCTFIWLKISPPLIVCYNFRVAAKFPQQNSLTFPRPCQKRKKKSMTFPENFKNQEISLWRRELSIHVCERPGVPPWTSKIRHDRGIKGILGRTWQSWILSVYMYSPFPVVKSGYNCQGVHNLLKVSNESPEGDHMNAIQMKTFKGSCRHLWSLVWSLIS